MPKYLIAFFMLAFLVGSCAPTPASPTPPPTAAVKPTMPPSPAPSATPTPVPQINQHLIVTCDNKRWTFLNADGSLQSYLENPGFWRPDESVSPDGDWLVYEFGMDLVSAAFEEGGDATLELLNLDNGTSRLVSKLISTDFPKNIEPLLESTLHYEPSLYGDDCANLECRRTRLKQDILESVGLYEWSPNGQELAFTAQIEGPSSDIYIYSLQDGSIRRLTDDLNTARGMAWSPDGKWILYTNDIPGTSLLTDVLGPNDYAKALRYVTDMEGKSFELSLPALSTEGDYWVSDGWITGNHYLFHTHGSSYRKLAILDAENQQVTEIWPYTMKYFLFDNNTQTIVLLSESGNDPNLPASGVYRVTLDGHYEKISNQMFYSLYPSPEILGIGGEKVYHITSDNSFKPIGPGESVLHSSSPNKKWFLINEGRYQRRYQFTLYSDTYQPIKSWMFDDYVLDTIWRPDSLGVFFFTDHDVHYVDIPDGEPRRLEVELHPSSDECEQTMCVGVCSAWRP